MTDVTHRSPDDAPRPRTLVASSSAALSPADTVSGHLADLRGRVERARAARRDREDDLDGAVVVADLETAYEELRVAEEELRAQHAQIDGLVHGHERTRWQQERMLAALPVATLTTDGLGVIRAVNAAAASMLQMRVGRLLGKPVVALFDPADRVGLRRLISRLARDGAEFRTRATVVDDRGARHEVEVDVSLLAGMSPEATWMLLDTAAPGSGEDPGAEPEQSLPSVLTRLAAVPALVDDLQSLLGQTAVLCRSAFADGVELTVALGPPGDPTALSSTAPVAQATDGAQIQNGEGPCVSAYAEVRTVSTDDLRHDARWPSLAPDVPEGVGGVLSVPLVVGGELVGCLNIYFPTTGLAHVDRRGAELLASTVASVLYEHGLKSQLRETASDMAKALDSRAVIDQAKGMVMAELRCTADEAFAHLVHLSSQQQVKVREVARMLVERRGGHPTR